MSEQRSGRQTIADISELKVKPTGSSTLVKVADHLSGFVNVRSYGAKGDGVTDDTAAIQAAIAAGSDIYFPPGSYRVSSIDGSGGKLSLKRLRGQGPLTQLHGKTAGVPVLDLAGSHRVSLDNFWIVGDATNVPSVGILAYRTQDNVSHGNHDIRSVEVKGDFSLASVITVSSEEITYSRCFLENSYPGAAALSISATNILGVTSPHITLPNAPVGGNTVHRFIGGRIASYASGNATQSTLILDTVRHANFDGVYWYSAPGSRSAIELRGIVTALGLHGGDGENYGSFGIYLAAGASVNQFLLDGWYSGRPIYGENGAEIKNSLMQGAVGWQNPPIDPPGAFALNVDVLRSSTVNLLGWGQGVQVRTTAIANIIHGGGGLSADVFPAAGANNKGNIHIDDDGTLTVLGDLTTAASDLVKAQDGYGLRFDASGAARWKLLKSGLNLYLQDALNSRNHAFFAPGPTPQQGAKTTFASQVELSGGALIQARQTVTYSASMTFDARTGNSFVITPTNGTAFAIGIPTGPSAGQRVSVIIRNASGGALGTVTWDGMFKMAAWTSPADGYSRSIDFQHDGTNWIEVGRTTADVPN
jgi:hypothetical protein